MFTSRHPQHDSSRVERPLGRRRRLLARAAVLTLGAGAGALSLASGPAHADGIGVDIDGCGITVTISTPVACPTPTSQPGVSVVDEIAPATVDVAVPVTLPGVVVNVDPGGDTTAPGAPAGTAGTAQPLVTAPPIVDDAAGAVGAQLPIPVATATVASPIANCVVDVAAVVAGVGCGLQATVPTEALPPVAAGAADAVIDDTSGLIDPTLAGAGTDTGAGVQLASTSQVALTTCTGAAVLGPVPDPCPAATAPTDPTGTDGGSAGASDTGTGSGTGGAATDTSNAGAGTASDQLAASGVGPIATQLDAAEGGDATLPTTGLAIGGILLAGAGSLSAGLATRRIARDRRTAR